MAKKLEREKDTKVPSKPPDVQHKPEINSSEIKFEGFSFDIGGDRKSG